MVFYCCCCCCWWFSHQKLHAAPTVRALSPSISLFSSNAHSLPFRSRASRHKWGHPNAREHKFSIRSVLDLAREGNRFARLTDCHFGVVYCRQEGKKMEQHRRALWTDLCVCVCAWMCRNFQSRIFTLSVTFLHRFAVKKCCPARCACFVPGSTRGQCGFGREKCPFRCHRSDRTIDPSSFSLAPFITAAAAAVCCCWKIFNRAAFLPISVHLCVN